MNRTSNERPAVKRWQRFSRLVSISLILCGCWLGVANIWRLTGISRELVGERSSESASELLADSDLLSGRPASETGLSEDQLEGIWQFAGSSVGIGLRTVVGPSTSKEHFELKAANPSEELDLTDFVEELIRAGVDFREHQEDGRDFRVFDYDSIEFSAWLVVSRLGGRWKFCGGGLSRKLSNAENVELRLDNFGTRSEQGVVGDTLGLNLPFTAEVIGTRFDWERVPVGSLLIVPLSSSKIQAALESAGYQVTHFAILSPEVWTATFQPPGKTVLYACRVVQLAASRCVMIVSKEVRR